MNYTDAFVGALAISAGLFVLLAGLVNWEWFFQLPKVHWLENRAGRGGARVFVSLLGFAVILLGLAIAAGLFERRASSREQFGPASSPLALQMNKLPWPPTSFTFHVPPLSMSSSLS